MRLICSPSIVRACIEQGGQKEHNLIRFTFGEIIKNRKYFLVLGVYFHFYIFMFEKNEYSAIHYAGPYSFAHHNKLRP